MFNDLDDANYEFNARYDYLREAYGDPCPKHGTLRWQADCPDCEEEAMDLMDAPSEPQMFEDNRRGAADLHEAFDDDDIPF